MAFAAARLRQQMDLDAPTILIVLDRLDLIEQVSSTSASITEIASSNPQEAR